MSTTINADESLENVKGRSAAGPLTEDMAAMWISGLLILIVLISAFANSTLKFPTPVFQWANAGDLRAKVLAANNLLLIAFFGVVFAALSSIAIHFSGGKGKQFIAGFAVVSILAIISLIIAGNSTMNYYGIEYVVFALVIGLFLGNAFKLPSWLRHAARSEFFIKTGLILLGTSIIFTNILQAGLPGILQALAVVAAVWFFAMWLCKRLKVDDEFAVILASAVSICGVSAAIVACGAIQGDRKKLSYITTLVLVVAVPMMILQPWIIRQFGIPEIVGGAWLGGTLDTTASVTAASESVGELATKAGVIVKFSQNVLIGFAAFFIAAWWMLRDKTGKNANGEKPGIGIVWERFPKFVIGFMVASLVFSFLIPAGTAKQVGGILNSMRTIWFALAFVAIGMEARLTDLVKMQGGRPAIAFVGSQLFNIIWTLLLAYLLFGGILLPAPDIR